jgi:hypothetical protein
MKAVWTCENAGMGLLWRQHFEGDKAIQVGITGFVYHSHPTFTDLLENAIVRDALADHVR